MTDPIKKPTMAEAAQAADEGWKHFLAYAEREAGLKLEEEFPAQLVSLAKMAFTAGVARGIIWERNNLGSVQ